VKGVEKMSDKFMGINEIKQKLGVSESTVMDMIHFEKLPAKKVEGVWQAKASDLAIWQDPELSTRKANSDKRAKAAAQKTDPDPDPPAAAKGTGRKTKNK
jgi:hypothetical protein